MWHYRLAIPSLLYVTYGFLGHYSRLQEGQNVPDQQNLRVRGKAEKQTGEKKPVMLWSSGYLTTDNSWLSVTDILPSPSSSCSQSFRNPLKRLGFIYGSIKARLVYPFRQCHGVRTAPLQSSRNVLEFFRLALEFNFCPWYWLDVFLMQNLRARCYPLIYCWIHSNQLQFSYLSEAKVFCDWRVG